MDTPNIPPKKDSTALILRTTRTDVSSLSGEDLIAYLDTQLALMRKLNINESLIFKYEVIQAPDGSGRYQLVKRSESQEAPDIGVTENNRSVNATLDGYSTRIGVATMERKGKYNDADRLRFSDYGSIELGEIDPFATI